MINGNEYSWEDIKIIIPGSSKPVEGAVEISYEEEKEHKNIYGRGDKPVAMGRGSVKYTAKLVLLQSDVEAMIATLPKGKSLTQLPPFLVTVGYAPDGGVATIDHLEYCRILKFDKGMKQGDPNKEITLDLLPGNIKYNV